MTNENQVIEYLHRFAPLDLAEDWDNVGLIVGDASRPINSVMTCLTLTPDVAAEAIEKNCDLIVSHHPVLFRSVQKLTTATTEGKMLLDLIHAKISVYSPHTAFDSAATGINQQLCDLFNLQNVSPLRPIPEPDEENILGSGRYGDLETDIPFNDFLQNLKAALKVEHVQYVADDLTRHVQRIGVACGAAGEFLSDALHVGCDVFVTGETRFHTCLEARNADISMILPGHYATERPAVEALANQLAQTFPNLKACWASVVETDPLKWSM